MEKPLNNEVTTAPVIPPPAIAVERGNLSDTQMEEVRADKYLSIRELSQELHFSTPYITRLCQNGRIEAIKPLGGRWRIPMSVVEYIRKKGLPVRPKEEIKKEEEPVKEILKITPTTEQKKKMGISPLKPLAPPLPINEKPKAEPPKKVEPTVAKEPPEPKAETSVVSKIEEPKQPDKKPFMLFPWMFK